MKNKKGSPFYENLRTSAKLSLKAVKYLKYSLESYKGENTVKMLEELHEIEHEADLKRHEIINLCAKTFMTPIDREDIINLSDKIDDITDKTEEILQRFFVNGIVKLPPMCIEFASNIEKCCELVCDTVNELENFKKSENINKKIIELNTLEETCDKIYIVAMKDLKNSSDNILDIIACREIYESMEKCADSCEKVGDLIQSIILKNS